MEKEGVRTPTFEGATRTNEVMACWNKAESSSEYPPPRGFGPCISCDKGGLEDVKVGLVSICCARNTIGRAMRKVWIKAFKAKRMN